MTTLCFGDETVGGAFSPPLPHSTLAAVPTSRPMRSYIALRERRREREGKKYKSKGKHSYRHA